MKKRASAVPASRLAAGGTGEAAPERRPADAAPARADTAERGRLHVYTGGGKGKTTAALGLVLRAVGAGWRVCFLQFTKGRLCSEHAALAALGDRVCARRYGSPCFVMGPPTAADVEAARAGLAEARRCLAAGACDLLVLDEACVAVKLGLFGARELLEVLAARPPHVEVVLTGRDADPLLLEAADLVTEMRAVKHYHDRGDPARRGIEC